LDKNFGLIKLLGKVRDPLRHQVPPGDTRADAVSHLGRRHRIVLRIDAQRVDPARKTGWPLELTPARGNQQLKGCKHTVERARLPVIPRKNSLGGIPPAYQIDFGRPNVAPVLVTHLNE